MLCMRTLLDGNELEKIINKNISPWYLIKVVRSHAHAYDMIHSTTFGKQKSILFSFSCWLMSMVLFVSHHLQYVHLIRNVYRIFSFLLLTRLFMSTMIFYSTMRHKKQSYLTKTDDCIRTSEFAKYPFKYPEQIKKVL
jgi:hypothetical protein